MLCRAECKNLFGHYFGGLRTFLSLNHLKFNRLTFSQCFKPLSLNFGKMNETIVSLFCFNKAKTLTLVEPFYRSASHA